MRMHLHLLWNLILVSLLFKMSILCWLVCSNLLCLHVDMCTQHASGLTSLSGWSSTQEECHKSSNQLGREFLPAATDLCGICLVEPLQRAPSIRLQCGHVVHLHCAKQKLLQGYPGPAISFGYLNCPQCPRPMQHLSLDADMRKHLELLRLVLLLRNIICKLESSWKPRLSYTRCEME